MGRAIWPQVSTINLTDYEPLVRKMSWICKRKLPRTSVLDVEDLQQEGRMHAIYVASRFDPNRGVKFLTLLTFGLQNRYGRILHEEWKRAFTAGPDGLARASEAASQGAVEAAMSLEVKEEAQLPDRYGKLKRPRLYLAYTDEENGVVLEQLTGGKQRTARSERMFAELPALPRNVRRLPAEPS